uniref:Uncharacterized protein n=1 Tax=viral metagenome TaxID=1070528 RepID=A0A6M3X5E0_9ZZZZ
MGQARRNKDRGIAAKKLQFFYLMKKVSNRTEEEIQKFIKHRFK